MSSRQALLYYPAGKANKCGYPNGHAMTLVYIDITQQVEVKPTGGYARVSRTELSMTDESRPQ